MELSLVVFYDLATDSLVFLAVSGYARYDPKQGTLYFFPCQKLSSSKYLLGLLPPCSNSNLLGFTVTLNK
jgi:hypothetical protein